MSLEIIAGASGSGKSTYAYNELIRRSLQHPRQQFIIIVPDQFSMSTTREICRLHPSGGILNIDVLSFSRLTHRILDEVGRADRTVLDDTGKNLILRRVALMQEDRLAFLKGKMRRPGYIHEVKSQISEFYQYDISPDDLESLIEKSHGQGYLAGKLQDLKVLYESFQAYINEKYITTEEALLELCRQIPSSKLLDGSCVLFDHFTGFTPVQIRVVGELMQVCERVDVTLCIDREPDEADRLFDLTKKTFNRLMQLAGEVGCEVLPVVYMNDPACRRYASLPAMDFLERQLLRFGRQVYDRPQDAIGIYEAGFRRDEVRWCCRRIRSLIRQGYEYRQIAIETGDMEGYSDLLRAELARCGIPFYMDTSRSVLQNQMVTYLRCLLRMLIDDFTADSVMGYLRSGLTDFTADETDRFDLYLNALGIRGRSRFSKTFDLGSDAEQAEEMRKRLMESLAPFLVPARTAREFTLRLYDMCTYQHLQEKCDALAGRFSEAGELSLAKEYEKIYGSIMELFDRIYDLIGDDEMDAAEYLSIFEAGVAEIRIGTIPQSVDQVMVGDMQRTRLEPVKALFFLGVNEGIIPQKEGNRGLLSEMEREYLLESGVTLAPGPREKLYEQRLYLYQNMTKPAEHLYLSYSLLDNNGKSLLPSYLIRHILSLYPSLKVERAGGRDMAEPRRIESAEDGLDDLALMLREYAQGECSTQRRSELEGLLMALTAAYRGDNRAGDLIRSAFTVYVPRPLSRTAIDAIYDPRGTISRLEQMAACPFAHFIRYGLGLREKQEYSFEQSDLGSIYHSVLERFFRSLKEEGMSLSLQTDDQIRERLHETLMEVAQGYGNEILFSSGRNEYRLRQMEETLLRSLKSLRHQFAKSGFAPAYFERRFEQSGGHPIRGIIDRVDVAQSGGRYYVKVVDYKTGNHKLDGNKLYYGVSLQLPIYLKQAVEVVRGEHPGAEVIPAGMFYYKVQNPLIAQKNASVEEELLREMRPQGMFLEEDEVLNLLDRDLLTEGRSDVIVADIKSGRLSSNSQSASSARLKGYLDYATQKADDLMQQIRDGNIAVAPFQTGKGERGFDSCAYCPYMGICGFDDKIPGYRKEVCPVKEVPEA